MKTMNCQNKASGAYLAPRLSLIPLDSLDIVCASALTEDYREIDFAGEDEWI
ncbi:MAG: hypothetical protein J6X69_04795 [Bacteroidales bacterium]|nr:hypothetical protein [Bacteroidales bacterium]